MILGDPVIYDPDSRRRRFVILGDPVIYVDAVGLILWGTGKTKITFDLWTVINQMG